MTLIMSEQEKSETRVDHERGTEQDIRRKQAGVDNESSIFTLYLIRHGEAVHNIEEKIARESARNEAEAQGLEPEEVEAIVKAAQVEVLNDETLFDASLSDMGKHEAESAREVMQELQHRGLPEPEEVLVSPLQRAMQTAAAIFPGNDIPLHVREDLRERKTGRACDLRQSSEQLAQRRSFSRFSLLNLRMGSLTKIMLEELKESCRDLNNISEDEELVADDEHFHVEEKEMLRDRTKKLAKLLMDSDSRVLAVVTHKAYLRELERGPLGQESATEFSNCEVRVYQLKCENYDLREIRRVA